MSQRDTRRPLHVENELDSSAVLQAPKVDWRNAAIIDEDGDATLPGAELPSAERVRALARHVQAESVAYQSVSVVGLQILERVLKYERAAAEAAISLAQRDKLAGMISALEQTSEALRSSMSSKASKMMYACTHPLAGLRSRERSWWYALTESIHALESGIDAASKIVSGQPKGGAARLLMSVITRQLRSHHNALLHEAEEWIG